MPITPQERKLVTIGVAVACGCKTCIREDMMAAGSLQVTAQEISDTVALAIAIRRETTDYIEKLALTGLDQVLSPEAPAGEPDQQRIETLVSVGAAFALNYARGLRKHLAIAKTLEIPDSDLREVTGLSNFMKSVAASHVEHAMCPDEYEDNSDTLAELHTPFGPEHCAWAHLCKPYAVRAAGSPA